MIDNRIPYRKIKTSATSEEGVCVWEGRVDRYKRDINHSPGRDFSIYDLLRLATVREQTFPSLLEAHGPYQEELETQGWIGGISSP
jgi:hypothetical protein